MITSTTKINRQTDLFLINEPGTCSGRDPRVRSEMRQRLKKKSGKIN
jgi:hypothetical protein